MGAREAERLIAGHGVKGFKFHPTVQGYHPYDKMAWPIYELINAHKLPAIFHTGHSGIGSGMRCGGGLRLSTATRCTWTMWRSTFPTCRSSWPTRAFRGRTRRSPSRRTSRTCGSISPAGAPSIFPKQLVQYANTLLKDRVLFGSDYPLITPERWMKDFDDAGCKPEVMPGILKGNAVRLLGLA